MNEGAKGNASNQYQQVQVEDKPAPPTLAEAGIDKNLAHARSTIQNSRKMNRAEGVGVSARFL